MKYTLSIIVISLNFILFSQNWMDSLPKSKAKSDYTFYDYQKAFNNYWAPFNVKNGYYYKNGVKIKAYGWKQFKRWEEQMTYQIDKRTGKIPYKSLAKNSKSQNEIEKTGSWISLGSQLTDGGYSGLGRVNCITFHPSNSNIYWVGTASGGIWKTTDDGNTWTPLSDHIEILSVSNIIVPTDYDISQTLYISTGDRDHAWDFQSVGVLKSTDGGTTWNSTGLSYALIDYAMINKLLLHPSNNNEIIAATSNGVYKTTDGGTTWNTQLTNLEFSDIEYNPIDPSIIYGSTFNGKIYSSINNGVNWTLKFSNTSVKRIELAVSNADPTIVYAAGENDSFSGIYKSTDSGNNFTEVFSGSTTNLLSYESDGGGTDGNGWYSLSFDVSPIDVNTILVGGVNTWRSIDGGISFQIVNHWWGDLVQAVHADKHILKFRSNGELFECNDGGLYHSNDNGTLWTDKTNGLTISQIYRLSTAQSTGDESITGLQDNGSKLFYQGIWADVSGGDGMDCLIDYSTSDIQYSSYQNGNFYRTFDHWENSEELQTGFEDQGAWISPLTIDPINPSRLYIGYSELIRSEDNGTSWETLTSINSSSKLRCVAVAKSNYKFIYISDLNNIWKSSNDGITWEKINHNLPLNINSISSILVKNNDENTVWVTMGGYNSQKVYVTTDGGATWSNMSNGLPEIPVFSIIQNNHSNASVQLYVGTKAGVYFKSGNNDWTSFNTGLPNVQISDLDIYYSTQHQNSILRAASYGRGLWENQVVAPDETTVYISTTDEDSTICSGNPINLIYNNYQMGSIHWQQSTTGTSNWNNVITGSGFTTTNLTTTNLAQTTYYRVRIDDQFTTTYSNPIKIQVLGCASVTELKNEPFKIFPNPSNGKFTIKLSNEELKLINVINLEGKIVYTKKHQSVDDEINIDLTNLKSGNYTIELIFSDSTYNSQITIEK